MAASISRQFETGAEPVEPHDMSGDTSIATPYGILDTQAHFIRDVPSVSILNEGEPSQTARPNDQVFVHDMRAVQVNPQFAEEIETCRRKISNIHYEGAGFMEEAVCFTPDGYFELKTARSKDKFLWVSGGSGRLAQALDPNGRHFDTKMNIMHNPEQVSGRGIIFMGVGRASNYYHWMGEQMPRLALLRKHTDLSSIDNIVVFVKEPVSFIPASVKALFPEFKGNVQQVRGHSTHLDEAFFFVPHPLASRSESGDETPKPTGRLRATWGSLLDFSHHFDTQTDRLIAPKGDRPDIVVVSREKAPMRKWLNEQALLDRLEGADARKILSEDLDFMAQINVFHHARVVIAQHGAGLANILFCKPGTRVIEVTGRSHARRSWDFVKLALARGLEYHVVVIDAELDAPYDAVAEPEERIPSLYASDLSASDEALARISELALG
ncbi:MAG: glycosyltransferase 61 family protein [Pseudomonadota bacterium]